MADKPVRQPGPDRSERVAPLLFAVRYLVPAAVVLGGLIVMALGSESDLEGGAGIAGAGLAVFALNWLYRASVAGDRERDEEEAARQYLDEHGHWPDQRAPAQRADLARGSGAQARRPASRARR